MTEKLKIGIVGCGRWGRNVIRTLVGLKERYPLEILGVVNTGKAENADFVRAQFGLTCDTGLDCLLTARPAALFIATPDQTHFDLAKRTLERGIHAFVEKPVALTLAETEQLVGLARKNHLLLSTGHLLVFHPGVRSVQDWLARTRQKPEAIFSSRLAQVVLTEGRTVLRSSLVHDLSMVDFFLKSVPVAAECRGFFKPMPDSEYVDVFLGFPDGEKVHLVGSSMWPEQERTFALWSKDYHFHLDGLTNALKIFRRKGYGFEMEAEEKPEGQPLTLELENFIQALTDPARLTVDSDHMLRVMRTIDFIERQ